MRIGKQYTYMLRAYGFASFDELLKFFKHRPPMDSRSSYCRSDQIFKQRSRTGLVSSSYSRAVEFPKAITDFVSNRELKCCSEFQYRTNYCARELGLRVCHRGCKLIPKIRPYSTEDANSKVHEREKLC